MVDLGQVIELKDLWDRYFHQIKIFYAVKCNNEPIFLKVLASLGIGFDCASKVCSMESEFHAVWNPNSMQYGI
jgi:ornithine decarboxylase